MKQFGWLWNLSIIIQSVQFFFLSNFPPLLWLSFFFGFLPFLKIYDFLCVIYWFCCHKIVQSHKIHHHTAFTHTHTCIHTHSRAHNHIDVKCHRILSEMNKLRCCMTKYGNFLKNKWTSKQQNPFLCSFSSLVKVWDEGGGEPPAFHILTYAGRNTQNFSLNRNQAITQL